MVRYALCVSRGTQDACGRGCRAGEGLRLSRRRSHRRRAAPATGRVSPDAASVGRRADRAAGNVRASQHRAGAGGGPLLQQDVYPLMQRLLDDGLTVMLATGGHRSIEQVPAGVIRIMGVKCPGSGESDRNDWSNMARLTETDEVKFVIKDRADFEFARAVAVRYVQMVSVRAVVCSLVHVLQTSQQL